MQFDVEKMFAETRRTAQEYTQNVAGQWWNLSNQGTIGVEESVSWLVRCPQRLNCMQEWYLGWGKVSCLERCPQFRSVLTEREVPL